MFKHLLLSLILIISSACATDQKPIFSWDDPENGLKLYVSTEGQDRNLLKWSLREVQEEDREAYKILFSEAKETLGTGNYILENIEECMKIWKDRSDLGHPNIRLTVLQNEQIVGFIQLGPSLWERDRRNLTCYIS